MRGEKTERELHCLKVIGDNIKAARKHRGLSQRDLAKKTGRLADDDQLLGDRPRRSGWI